MPAFLENDLRQSGEKKGFSGKRLDKYVYGAMNNLGAMHGSQETEKGKEMEEKHESDLAHHNAGHDTGPADPGKPDTTYEPIQEFDRASSRAQRIRNAKNEFNMATKGISPSLSGKPRG